MDRRAVFFVIAGVACLLMAPVGVSDFREVAVVTGIVYFVLALLSLLDRWSRSRPHRR
jgi:hypothetical protein